MSWRDLMDVGESVKVDPYTHYSHNSQNSTHDVSSEDCEDCEDKGLKIITTDVNLHDCKYSELKLLAADDWPECESKPNTLEAFAKSVATRKLREQGIKPDNYTQASHCHQCGPIWLWEGAPTEVQACVWCFNRIKDIDLPRPTLISCIDCKYFTTNNHTPNAGIGECQKGLTSKFAQAKHNCNQYKVDNNDQ